MARGRGILVEKVVVEVAEVDVVGEMAVVAEMGVAAEMGDVEEMDVVDGVVIYVMREVVYEDKIVMKMTQDS
jgi:hypothetical protein